MEKYNFYKVKFISNFIYFTSVPIISYVFLTNFYNTDDLNIKGFLYSYFLGIFLINIFSNIFEFINYKLSIQKNTIIESSNENEKKAQRLKKVKILDQNKEKLITKNLLFIIGTAIYIILFVNYIDILLKGLGLSTGLINLITYFSKILLFSGAVIPLNIFITTENIFTNKAIIIQTINKLLLFAVLSLTLLNTLNLKGLVFTISLLELIEVIFKIALIKVFEKLENN